MQQKLAVPNNNKQSRLVVCAHWESDKIKYRLLKKVITHTFKIKIEENTTNCVLTLSDGTSTVLD